jgi:membrane protease YdiL (CAAX protease family)
MSVRFDAATVVLLVWALIVAPVLAWLSAKRLESGKPLAPKVKRMQRVCIALVLAALCAMSAAESNHLSFGIEFETNRVLLAIMVAAFLLTAASRGIKKAKPEAIARRRKLNWPQSPKEYAWTIVLSVAAGVGEELVYRGALYGLLLRLTSSIAIATAISIVAFGLAHMAYGRLVVIGVTYIGLVFQVLYLLTGNLLTTIMLHTLYDIGIFTVVYYRERHGEFAFADSTSATSVVEENAAMAVSDRG